MDDGLSRYDGSHDELTVKDYLIIGIAEYDYKLLSLIAIWNNYSEWVPWIVLLISSIMNSISNKDYEWYLE